MSLVYINHRLKGKTMKKIFRCILIVLFILQYVIYENHRKVENEWGKWKEATLDGWHPEKPGPCFYCDYIKPLIDKYGHDDK